MIKAIILKDYNDGILAGIRREEEVEFSSERELNDFRNDLLWKTMETPDKSSTYKIMSVRINKKPIVLK